MKYVAQFAILAVITGIAEIIKALVPLPIPASIYGLVLLLLLLLTRVIKLEQIEKAADLLLVAMPLFFIEPNVSLLPAYGLIQGKVIRIILLCLVSAFVTNAVTGHVAQAVIRFQNRKRKQKEGTVASDKQTGEEEIR